MALRSTKLSLLVLLIAVLSVALASSSRLLSAAAIASPSSTKVQVIKLALRPPYRISAPHRTLVKTAWRALFPVVHAVSCDCSESKPNTAGCHCPNCVSGPCTQYTCQYTGNASKACATDPNGWKYAPTACQLGCPPTTHPISCTPVSHSPDNCNPACKIQVR